jgi:VWFA-related protein
VDAVLVPARVFDDRGNFVQGLTSDQFVLLEDGRPQQVMSVIAEDAPASVLLALDMSASMQNKIEDLRNAANRFLGSVRAYDAVSVAAFNENLSILTRPGANDEERRAALARIDPWGGTALFDSLVRAADVLRRQPAPRAIVAFTDGEDVASVSSVQTVRAALQRADIVLYLIVGAEQPAMPPSTRQLARVAEETGGAAWFTPRMDAVGDRFTAIVNDLTNGYVLLYVPERAVGGGEWRELKVEVQGGRHTVRARQGYLALQR